MSKPIPRYALYGEAAWRDTFNFEWIPERSGHYDWHIRPHMHEALIQVLLLTEGGARVVINDAVWQARAPALLIVPALSVHGFDFSRDVNGPVVTAAQRALESVVSVAMPALQTVLRTPAVLELASAPQAVEAMMPIFLAIEREARAPAPGQAAAGMGLLTAFFVQAARPAGVVPQGADSGHSRKHTQIEAFRALVDQEFRSHAPLSRYAQALGITVGQLSRLCREVLGISALDVLNQRLLHEAQRELAYSNMSVKQLAGILGFVDDAYFGRFFKKQTGTTPKAFRAGAAQALSGA